MPITFLECALNGPWSQARQPLMPITRDALIAEGIACARAGAAVIHLHVYDPATGLQWENPQAYARVIEGIRAAIIDKDRTPNWADTPETLDPARVDMMTSPLDEHDLFTGEDI